MISPCIEVVCIETEDGDYAMIQKRYRSAEVMIKNVRESKEQYEKGYLSMSFMDKLRVLVRLQEKAYFMGKTRFKPWPIEEK